MRLLTVPNWSFGRNKPLLRKFEAILDRPELELHYLQGDIDHNRTVSAFSGDPEAVLLALQDLAIEAFDTIDLNHHVGIHPRIGALDVCPFLPWVSAMSDFDEAFVTALAMAERFAAWVGEERAVPVYLYEQSAKSGQEATLPTLRKGGFGGLIDRTITPDFGPNRAHPQLGVSVVGVRGFLIALNINLNSPSDLVAKRIASRIRALRAAGDPRFIGVRALGLRLISQDISQVSLNLTLPDLSPIDPIVKWVNEEAGQSGVLSAGLELIGVVRVRDLEHGTAIYPRPSQVLSGIFQKPL